MKTHTTTFTSTASTAFRAVRKPLATTTESDKAVPTIFLFLQPTTEVNSHYDEHPYYPDIADPFGNL